MRNKVLISSAISVALAMIAPVAAQVETYSASPFQAFRARPSRTLEFLTSETGKTMASRFQPLAGYLAGMGMIVVPAADTNAPVKPARSVVPMIQNSIPCNAGAGALFNLEPAAGSPEIGWNVPQIAASLDYVPQAGILGSDLVIETGDDWRGVMDQFLNVGDPKFEFDQVPNAWGYTMSGYYVHRQGSDCSPSFEGAFPRIHYPQTQDMLYGYSPTVSVDSTRGRVYAADVRYSAGINGLGFFATTINRLNDPNACPDGTHLTSSNGANVAASHCWPIANLLNQELNIFPSTFSDKPYVKADQRAAGIGAGDVYVTWTNFDLFNGISYIELLACPSKNFTSPAACSDPMLISGSDPYTQFSNVAIRPDGVISVTYINVNFVDSEQPPYERQVFDIKHVYCTPNGAPNPPTCSAPTLLASELWPMPFPEGGPVSVPLDFPAPTIPVHDYRMNGDTAEEFVIWGRCKVDPYYAIGVAPVQYCVQPQVVFSWSATDSSGNPLGWSSPIAVDQRRGRQIMPSLQADTSRGSLELVYLSSNGDYFNERYQVVRSEILAGSYTASPASSLTSVPIEPNADPFIRPLIGENLGLASHQGRAYVSFTGQAYTGTFDHSSVPGANDLVLAFTY